MSKFSRILLCIGLISLITSCEKKDGESSSQDISVRSTAKSVNTGQAGNDGSIASEPSKSLLAIPQEESWERMLYALSSDERRILEATNNRYSGALNFSTPQEYEALINAGFPRLEEWLKVDRMSDEELRQLAEKNDRLGRLFYADRLAQRVEADPGTLGNRDPKVERMAIDATTQAAIALRNSRDAFSVYVYGKTNSVQMSMSEPMAAAIMLAGDRGDSRSEILMHSYNQAHPNMRIDIVQVQYKGMKRLVSQG